MEKVIVLGLGGCRHCEELKKGLSENAIPYKFLDADKETKLADRMEDLLKTQHYPMVIIEKTSGSVYLYRVENLEEAKESSMSFAIKVGCTSTDSMIEATKKYIK